MVVRSSPNPSRSLRRLIVHAGLIPILAGVATHAHATQGLSVNPKPNSFAEVENVVNNLIPQNAAAAQCGGWDWEDDSVLTKIADTAGVPGRNNANPLGDTPSGMGVRADDPFIAPGTDVPVCGFRTACRPGDPPFYRTLPCQRPLGGIDPEHPGDVAFTCGGGDMPDDGHVCPVIEIGDAGLCWYMNTHWLYGYYEKVVPHTDKNCGDPDVTGQPPHDTDGVVCSITLSRDGQCLERAANQIEATFPGDPNYVLADIRYCCTHQSIFGELNTRNGRGTGALGDGRGDLLDNCVLCEGEECRYCTTAQRADGSCPVEPDAPRVQYLPPWNPEVQNCENVTFDPEPNDDEIPCDPLKPETHPNTICGIFCPGSTRQRGPRYRSYYRHYTALYERAEAVNPAYVPQDDLEKHDIPVSCYRQYKEFDPKEERVTTSNKHCVIALYYEDEEWRHVFDLPQTQVGKGAYHVVHDGVEATNERAPYDDDESLWDNRLGNAYSITNGNVQHDDFNDDITLLLYEPTDVTHLVTPFQIDSNHLWSSGSLLRTFDDSVHNREDGNDAAPAYDGSRKRVITEWWQEQQSFAHQLFYPPRIHLLLAPTWSIGLDPLQPMTVLQVEMPGELPSDPRIDVVDVQLQATPDLIDAVKQFLIDSMLPRLEQEMVPVVVPSIPQTKIRGYIEGWEKWVAFTTRDGGTAPAEVTDLIARLYEYAQQHDKARLLRSEAAKFAGLLFEEHREITETVGQWFFDVAQDYTTFRNDLVTLNRIQSRWKSIERSYQNMHDDDSLPWCHNDRYTTSIYSLLDTWMVGRPDMTGDLLPRLQTLDAVGAVFDFTTLRRSTGSLKVPVIQPIQVSMETSSDVLDLSPPTPGDAFDPADVPVLPPLPPIPTITVESGSTIFPDVFIGEEPPGITFSGFSPGQLSALEDTVDEIRRMIAGMRNEYRLFWESMSSRNRGVPEEKKQDCYAHHSGNCVHAEMDLKERLQRIGSRPLLFLWHDYWNFEQSQDGRPRPKPGTVGYELDESCQPADWACQLLSNEEDYPMRGWTIDWNEPENDPLLSSVNLCGAGGKTIVEQMRSCMFSKSLVRPGVAVEHLFVYSELRNTIVPSFAVYPAIQLIPNVRLTEEERTSLPTPPL